MTQIMTSFGLRNYRNMNLICIYSYNMILILFLITVYFVSMIVSPEKIVLFLQQLYL